MGIQRIRAFTKPCCPGRTFYEGKLACMNGTQTIRLGDFVYLDKFNNMFAIPIETVTALFQPFGDE